jgi:hypothetical protein
MWAEEATFLIYIQKVAALNLNCVIGHRDGVFSRPSSDPPTKYLVIA